MPDPIITEMQLAVRAQIPSATGGRATHRDNYIFPVDFKGLSSDDEALVRALAEVKTWRDLLYVICPTYSEDEVLVEEQRRADNAAAALAAASSHVPTPEELKEQWLQASADHARYEAEDTRQRAELVAAGVLDKADLEAEVASIEQRERELADEKAALETAIAAADVDGG